MKSDGGFLAHEKLEVYEKTLEFVRLALPVIDRWPRIHAVRDQMDRACESLVTNLVKASRLRRTERGAYHLECAFGSVLECAACLDVGFVKGLAELEYVHNAKSSLQTIARMQAGLRSSWLGSVRETNEQSWADTGPYFQHESLKVYQVALEMCRVAGSLMRPDATTRHRYYRRIDEAATSIVLNLAEGNGRLSSVEHRRFIEIADDAGARLAAYLDLASISSSVNPEPVKVLLRQTMGMLSGLKGYLDEK